MADQRDELAFLQQRLIDGAINRAINGGEKPLELQVSEPALFLLRTALKAFGRPTPAPAIVDTEYRGVAIVLQDSWAWGWKLKTDRRVHGGVADLTR